MRTTIFPTMLLIGALTLGGCELSSPVSWKPYRRDPAPVPDQPECDPVRVEEKGEMGIHYDPQVFEQGVYSPEDISNMGQFQGFDGLAQHTFARAGGDFDVDISADGKHMAFSTTRFTRNPDICVQSVAGKAVSLRTSDPASDMMPKFSPDGKTLAWCSNRYGNWDILRAPADGTPDSRPEQLTGSSDDEIHPTFSPDGKLLAFSRYNAMDGRWRIWVVQLETKSLSSITEGLFPEFRPATKTANGETVYTIAYQRHRKRDIPWYSIWTIDMTMSRTGQVETAGAPTEIVSDNDWAAINPAWSPDGDYLAFASVRKSPHAQMQARIYRADDVWVVKADGCDLTQITSHIAPDWAPRWAKDSASGEARIFFNSQRNGYVNIWSVRPLIPGMMLSDAGR